MAKNKKQPCSKAPTSATSICFSPQIIELDYGKNDRNALYLMVKNHGFL
jgi:hypothetical protein